MGGGGTEAVTPTNVANVKVLINKNRRVTLQEGDYQFSIGRASAYQIYTKSCLHLLARLYCFLGGIYMA